MTDGEKKDILEFKLEDLSVPQSIALMMQAASAAGAIIEEGNAEESMKANERLAELCEKLEARVEDAIDAAKAVREEAVPEDNPNDPTYTDIDGHSVTLVHEFVDVAQDNVITKVVVDGAVFALLCNEPVSTDFSTGERTKCIKAWGHERTGSPECEDMEGNTR